MKQIVAEEALAEYLCRIKSSDVCKGGILIGTEPEAGKQTLVRLAQCPDQKGKTWSSVSSVDPSWLAGHALQVTNLLPGGIEVIGMFLIAPDNALKDCMNTLRQAMLKYHKINGKSTIQMLREDSEYCLLAAHVSNLTGGVVSCKQFNVLDYKDTGSHVDWKFQTKLSNPINSITTHFDFKFETELNVPDDSKFLETFYGVIQKKVEKFRNIYLEQDGEIKALTEPFEKNLDSSKKHTKGKKQTQKPQQKTKSFNCNILVPFADDVNENETVFTENITHEISCNGKLMATCYFHGNTTCEIITRYLTEDIIRSLRQRIELVQDDIAEGSTNVTLPKRVLCKASEDYVNFSEYLMEGEHKDDCVDRIKDVLDMTSEVTESGEKISTVKTVTKSFNQAKTMPQPNAIEEPPAKSNLTTKIAACTAVGVGLIAWVLSNMEL